MSEPVYRIDVEHMPNDVQHWYAKAYRISDDSYMAGSGHFGDTSDEAIDAVRHWITVEALKQQGYSVFANESGELVGAPEDWSIRA
jgi:hypothetical protein